jgi:t-SNARE complex subunit (syntaxin)
MIFLGRVKRQLEMAGEHLTTEEVDEMLDSNSSDIFYRQLNPLSLAGRIALEDATNRHNEILNLEQSIRELNEIFQDVFDMVRSQVYMSLLKDQSTRKNIMKKLYIWKVHEKWSIFCFYGMF